MIRFTTAFAALASALVATSAAHADARKDIVDIRSGALPVRHEMLGWTASNDVVVRTLACGESGTAFCNARLGTLGPGVTVSSTKLLEIVEVYCSKGAPCAALDTATAAAFISAETRALAALPARTPGAVLSDPASPFGKIAGDATTVGFRSFAVGKVGDEGVSLELVLKGARGAVEQLALLESKVQRIESAPKIAGAYASPDGKRVAIAVEYATGVMCWGPIAELDVRVVDVAQHRARLANTVGFRAYTAGSMTEAYADFVEATSIDARYALAWFNRAALASRLGHLDDAASALQSAVSLDAKMEARACKDGDFDALRKDGRAAASLRCSTK